MGFFSREPEWATIPIEREERWARQLDPHPDVADLARHVVAQSNRQESQVDMVRLVMGIFNVFEAQGSRYLDAGSVRNGSANLAVVMAREDLTADMPWDFLTHFEATGVAAHNMLSADLTDEEFLGGLTAAVNDGNFDL